MRKILLSLLAVGSFGFYSQADVCTSSATATGGDQAGTTATVTDFSCVGANPIASATLDATIGPNCTVGGGNWYYYNIDVDGVIVATAQCDQTGFDLTPYLPFTSVSIIAVDDPVDGINDNVTLTLDVNLTFFPACSSPANLGLSNLTAMDADLTWDAVGSAVDYNVEWGTPGFAPGTGAELSSATAVAGLTTNASGLAPQTSYEFYVQTNCGAASVSTWAGPFAFTTPCTAVVAPWSDDLEALTPTGVVTTLGCYSGSATGAIYQWTLSNGGTPSGGTGPNTANSGTQFFFTEASGAGIADEAILITPQIDVTGIAVPQVNFSYHMFGGQIGDLNVEWSNDGGATWNSVTTISGQQQAAQTDAFLLSETAIPAATGTIQLRFRAVSNGSFQGDISIDDIAVIAAPTCPNPTNFAVSTSDASSVTLGWTAGNTETSWMLEYGPVGFTPGTGTSMITSNNPETISGLNSNEFFEVYLQAVCAPADSSTLVGPITFNTYNQGQFMDADNACPPSGFVDISATGTANILNDDGEVGVAMPFPFLFQGTFVTDATIGSNGGMVFGSQTLQVGFGNGNMAGAADGVYPFWDDLGPESGDQGVFYETVGTSPNQQFIVQWNKSHLGGNGGTYIFQVVIDEATGEIYYVYDVVEVGDAFNDFGGSATVGIAGPANDVELSFNNQQYLTDNTCAHFFYTDCPNPTAFTVDALSNDEATISWSAGLAGETDWTVIYGVQGFDPMTGGTSITTTTPSTILPGLDDITTYEVYIYADCNPGALQSNGGLVGTFATLPNCSDPTGVTVTNVPDSIFTDWNWVESSGVGTYPSTGFNLQYGLTGFDLGTGTIVNADNNFSDTTEDMTLLGGGVYEMYVQAVCGSDTSNYVGPITFVAPLTNDTVCGAIALNADGTVYTLDNTTATSDPSESAIAPPTTGFQTTTGWGDSNLDFTTWFTFDAPASGNVRISGTDVGFDGQMAVFDATDCSDFATFTQVAANDDDLNGLSGAPNFTVCGLTPGNTYYLLHDAFSTFAGGTYSIAISPINVEAGTSNGIIDICTGDTADLFTGITGNDAGGVWTEAIPTAGFNGSLFPSAGLAYQVFDFEYTVVDGCATDSIIQQVQVAGPSSAGNDGALTVCQNEPFNLLSGLTGNVDLGGTWYDPSNAALAGADVTASSIPGQFNYDYITSNGVCPPDTANVVVTVDAGCDHLNVQDLYFNEMSVYPNPSNGVVFVENFGSTEIFNYEVTDVNGKVISAKANAINGDNETEINLNNLETGLYLIRVYNDNAERTFRVVLD